MIKTHHTTPTLTKFFTGDHYKLLYKQFTTQNIIIESINRDDMNKTIMIRYSYV